MGFPPSLARFVKKSFTVRCEVEKVALSRSACLEMSTVEAESLSDAVGLLYTEGWVVVEQKGRPAVACRVCVRLLTTEVLNDGSAGDRRSQVG
jgi:hypothetical protein